MNEDNRGRGALERSASKVFRPGDWNRNDRKLLAKTVTQKDFTIPVHSTSINDNKDYNIATHFELGSVESATHSSYHKDFAMTPKIASQRPVLVSEPAHSKLFPCDIDTNFISTKHEEFKDNGRDFILSLRKERMSAMDENKKRHASISVPISFKQEPLPPIPCKLMSITTSDFHQPPSHVEEENHCPTAQYNHLSGDYNKAFLSEAKQSYTPHMNASRKLRNESLRRQQDNKSTHFVFGVDRLDEKKTEHDSQYRLHLPVDPSLKPAGKSLPHKNIYSHIYPCMSVKEKIGNRYVSSKMPEVEGGNCEKELLPASVMKQDYVPQENVR